MGKEANLLWVDFSSLEGMNSQLFEIKRLCQVSRITKASDIAKAISSNNPDMICFEFDYAKPAELLVVNQTKSDYPSIPIVILTEYHSEELAVWALRSRVWDYFVKPIPIDNLLKPLRELSLLRKKRLQKPRAAISKEFRITQAKNEKQSRITKTIFKAQNYAQSHLGEKLSINLLADLCDMSPFHFSRTFKQVCGVNFRDFLIKARIKKAAELLTNSDLSITEISYEVGFQDLSNFSRTFRRYTKISPKSYRENYLKNDNNNFNGTAINE